MDPGARRPRTLKNTPKKASIAHTTRSERRKCACRWIINVVSHTISEYDCESVVELSSTMLGGSLCSSLSVGSTRSSISTLSSSLCDQTSQSSLNSSIIKESYITIDGNKGDTKHAWNDQVITASTNLHSQMQTFLDQILVIHKAVVQLQTKIHNDINVLIYYR